MFFLQIVSVFSSHVYSDLPQLDENNVVINPLAPPILPEVNETVQHLRREPNQQFPAHPAEADIVINPLAPAETTSQPSFRHLWIKESLNRLQQTTESDYFESKHLVLHLNAGHFNLIQDNLTAIKKFGRLTIHFRSFDPDLTNIEEMHDSDSLIGSDACIVKTALFSKKDTAIAAMEQEITAVLNTDLQSNSRYLRRNRAERLIRSSDQNFASSVIDENVFLFAEQQLQDIVNETLGKREQHKNEVIQSLTGLLSDVPAFLLTFDDTSKNIEYLFDTLADEPCKFDLKLKDCCTDICGYNNTNEMAYPVCLNRNLSCRRILNYKKKSACCCLVTCLVCGITYSCDYGIVAYTSKSSLTLCLSLILVDDFQARNREWLLKGMNVNIPYCPKTIRCFHPRACRLNMAEIAEEYPHCLETTNFRF
jgi:hypothetical protein